MNLPIPDSVVVALFYLSLFMAIGTALLALALIIFYGPKDGDQ